MGVPEGLIPLSHAIIYACEAEKSNSVIVAMNMARSDAENVFIAVKQWLNERLKLEISEEKSKIVNLKS